VSNLPSGSGLWSDEPDDVDLLAFSAVAETAMDAILDEALDPVAIGISGSWGSGKTTVLRLVERGLRERNLGPERQILVVATDPWRYDPSVGAKETLIGEILGAIKAKLAEQNSETATSKAVMLVKKLAKRVQWAKSTKLAARTALTLQLPNLEDLTSLIAEPRTKTSLAGSTSSELTSRN
jgi:predicted KAP-like P-loop ATPase